ncbi:MAG: response regulator [Verrucomicrobiota bacterium]
MNTKKRIIFVDDESLVLQGLQRMLRTMRNEWEMEFVDSGSKALERMGQAGFDVVVSDMRMPGMNGAQLLNEVMMRYPATVRLILSGHADQDLIMKCVGSTHQFLSKPCDADALKATVGRASALDAALQNETLKKLTSRMDRLPSLPSLYIEVVEKLQQPETTLEEIAAIIAKDIGMTAKILKLVNSAFFGLRRQIGSTEEAVAYLGLDTIKALVLSINAFSQFEQIKIGGFSFESLWDHSLNTAAAAKLIALAENAERKMVDEAFIAGMLHDTGKLVLASNFAEQYNEVFRLARENKREVVMAELDVFGATHADVGGYLLGLWGLPVPVVEAIALHHNPGKTIHKTFSPLTAVHAADVLVHESQMSGTGISAGFDANYLGELGLSDRPDVWRTTLRESTA